MTANRLIGAIVLAACAIAAAGVGLAQRSSNSREGHTAGRFDYYQLVLSWSPTHCEDNSRGRRDTQCGPRRARPFAFVLHGLWPQYERGYPEFCRTRQRPYVPNAVIDGMMDIMPSRGLIIHQYKKHGTCSGYSPADYFKASRQLYRRIKIPARYVEPSQAQLRTADEVVQDFIDGNPNLRRDMISVVCKRGGANQLKEVRICFDRRGGLRSCGGRANRHRCSRKKMYIPPVRLRR